MGAMTMIDKNTTNISLKLETVSWGIALTLTMISLFLPPLRYFAYLIPFVALIHGLAEGRFNVPDLVKPLLLIVIAGLCFLPFADVDGLKDIFFITSGISISLVLKKIRINSYYLLWLFIFGSILIAFEYNDLAGGLVFDIMKSKSSFEGNFAFLFGILSVYAAITRQWKLLYISFFASLFALKRIVLVAEVVCILLAILPEHQVRRLLNPFLMLAVNLIFIFVVILYANHTFDHEITYFTGQSANQLGMGRQDLYSQITKHILDKPLQFIFTGAGPGAAYQSLGSMSGFAGHNNLHSDVLKIFYEYGLIVFSLFIFVGYKTEIAVLRILFLYANIVFITDNVLIYHFFLFFLSVFSVITEDYIKNVKQII